MMLVSPTEPEELKALGIVSSLPEEYGADFLWGTPHGIVGVQRKAVPDLLASLSDGRLAVDLARLDSCDAAVLVMEGRTRWTADNRLIDRAYRREAWEALLLSVQFSAGVPVVRTDSLSDTVFWLRCAVEWFSKETHRSLRTRPKTTDSWGVYNFSTHMLQSFPGIGPELAERIVRHFGGVPLRWTVTERELMSVKGIGQERARAMIRALEGGAGGGR